MTQAPGNSKMLIGGGLLGGMVLLCVLGPWLHPVDPLSMSQAPFAHPFSPGCLLGADFLGRDLLARILAGGKASLTSGVIAGAMAVSLGVGIGALAGTVGGRMAALLDRGIEFFQLLPALLLAMVVIAFAGPSLPVIAATIGAVIWPSVARITRAEVLRVRGMDYVMAARAGGAPPMRMLIRVILPNALPAIAAASGHAIGTAVLFEAGLSFLGLGDPNRLSWGLIIGQNRSDMLTAWWVVTFPGLAIFATVMGVVLLSAGLGERLTPGRRRSH